MIGIQTTYEKFGLVKDFEKVQDTDILKLSLSFSNLIRNYNDNVSENIIYLSNYEISSSKNRLYYIIPTKNSRYIFTDYLHNFPFDLLSYDQKYDSENIIFICFLNIVKKHLQIKKLADKIAEVIILNLIASSEK